MSNQYFENNPNLNHQEYHLSLYYKGINLTFLSDNGIFSKNQIDFGTTLLLKNIPPKPYKKVLDVGCGVGIIGLTISKVFNVSTDLIDVNLNAIELTKKNIKLNDIPKAKVFKSDAYEFVKDQYDLIVTNPPIRAGKTVVLKILTEAINHLTSDGALIFVVKQSHGAKSYVKTLSEIYKQVEILTKDNDFWIIKATK